MRGDDDAPQVVLARLTWEAAPGDEAPLRHAQVRLRRLLTALRLYDAAGIVARPARAWTRTGGGAVAARSRSAGGAAPRGVCVDARQQEDELRAFLLARSPAARRAPASWPGRCGRFELASERAAPSEALTDILLALRALLEPEGPQTGRLAGRVAALCAMPEPRAAGDRAHRARSSRWSAPSSPAWRPTDAALENLVDELDRLAARAAARRALRPPRLRPARGRRRAAGRRGRAPAHHRLEG